jgi:hypothetical protein
MAAYFGTSSMTQLEAENYDSGGQDVTYHDTTPGNYYGQYRNEDVDVEWGVCGTWCAAVDHIAPGEWSEYTISVGQTWMYSLTLSDAASANESMHIDLDGASLTGPMTIAATTDPRATSFNYQFKLVPTYVNVCLPKGNHVLRVGFDGPDLNAMALDFVQFVPVGPCAGSDGGDGG